MSTYPNKTMDKAQALLLTHGRILRHVTLRNADNTPVRARVNGKIKLWKRKPDDYLLPMKHGLRDCFYITSQNEHVWYDVRVQ